MSKAAPAPLKTSGAQIKSAWSNGPPRDTSASSTPRSQSPAPTSPAVTTHSRRPSALSGAGYNARPTRGSIVGKLDSQPQTSASTVKEQGPPVSLPSQNQQTQQNQSSAKNEARSFAFGSITDKLPTTAPTPATNGKPAPPSSTTSAVSVSATASTSSGASPAPAAPSASSATTTKQKVDVKSFFRANNADSAPSPGPSSFAETVGSPSMRNTLPLPGHAPQFPGPSQHGQGPQGHAPQHMYGQQPPQQQPFRPGSAPRSPSFTRQMPNGAPGVRPHVQSGPPAPGASIMSSPRLSAAAVHPQHQQPQQQQSQMQGMQQHQGQPMAQMPPQHMPQYAQWNGYYYAQPHFVPGVPMGQEYPPYPWMTQMQPPQTPHGAPAQLGHPPAQPHAPHGVPVSPRQPPQPLHQHPPPLPPQQSGPPGTPPAGVASALPQQTRLNSGASAFVPGGGRRIKITDASGHAVDFSKPQQGGSGSGPASSGSPSPVPFQRSQRMPVRIETEESRKRREEEQQRLRRDQEEKARKEKEEKEREVERARKAKEEEEERERKRVEEARLKREEEERVREEEEERKKKEELLRKEQEERLKKEEEERLRKEEEERKRLEEEEKERLRREEEERIKREEEERLRKEEDEKKERELAEAAAAAKAKAEEEEQREHERERVAKAAAEAEAEAEAKSKAEKEKDENKASELAASTDAAVASAPISSSPESRKIRPVPGPLDLSAAQRSNIAQPLPSALATARHIHDLGQVSYPSGIMSPKPELNKDAKDGKFRYDREFLLQFMNICKDKPDNMPRLDALGLEAVEPSSHSMGRSGSGRRGVSGSMGPPSSTSSRQASIGLGISSSGQSFSKSVPGFAMGQFSTPKLTSEERFNRSTSLSMGTSNAGMQFATSRTTQMVRSSSQGGPGSIGSQGNKRSRSHRGKARGEPSQFNTGGQQSNSSAYALSQQQSFEPVAPLEQSANRWVPTVTSRRPPPQDEDSPLVVEKKVRALLNKLTMEKFDSISNQIISWANKSENEKDGRTLIQVIRLVFEKATDEANWSEMYARLCRKMMEQISPNVQDDGIRNAEGKPITGGQLFRKYLLNRCQEDFERGWSHKEATAAAAVSKAAEDKATKEANEKSKEAAGEEALYSVEYYAAAKAKRQGLGLVKFIGELFKLQMLTERIMHECIKKLLSNVDNPEEEEIESLCKLLTTVGQSLDSSKAKGHIDIYFSRMNELAKSNNVTSRMQFMLLDVIELRARKWNPRGPSSAPKTIAQIHEDAAKDRAQQEKDSMNRSINMSRGGSRRGADRNDPNGQQNADGWSMAGSGPPRQQAKAGDLTHFGKITKSSGSQMSFAPTSVFNRGPKRDSAPLARTSSSTNMFSALEGANEAPASAPTSRQSRPPSRLASVDLTQSQAAEATPSSSRPRLNLLPRSKPIAAEGKPEDQPESSEPVSEDEKEQEPSMSEEEAKKKIGNDVKEFFAIRNLDEAEDYFTKLPITYRHLLVDKLVTYAIESKETDAKLVGDLFERANEKGLCSVSSFEEGFLPIAELLDDIAIDAPKALDLMAIMMKGARFGDESKSKIASKSMDSDKLLALLA